MKDELPKSKGKKSLDERFARHPHMYEQMQRIADQMEQAIANGATADEAEEMAIKQINELGRAMLTDWAKAQHERSVQEAKKQTPSAIRDSKKTKLADDLWPGGDTGADFAQRPTWEPAATVLF